MKPVRTRFAPSPTGYLHVGGIRTALFAWLIARQNKGQFILRLEDTDKSRQVSGAKEHIIKSLKILGLDYDEGPDKAGQYGPYEQSQRLTIYNAWAKKLVELGLAYADPYTEEQVQAFRDQAKATKQPYLFRNHRPAKLETWDGKQPLRFKSSPKAYDWNDVVMGELHSGPEVIDDFILIKSDGFPTYNFAHVIDDHEMKISHVLRGQEFLASVPNYLNLYEALNLELPILATLPHILASDGRKKLSKRDGAKDVLQYIEEGYLKQALISFIATLGWNDGTTQEVFSIEELISKFSLDRVQKGGAHFDEQRLNWINGQLIRGLGSDELLSLCKDYWPAEAKNFDDDYKKRVLAIIKDRLKYLAELTSLSQLFFVDLPIDDRLIKDHKLLSKLSPTELKQLLITSQQKLSGSDFTEADLASKLNELLSETGQKPAVLFSLIRIAITQAPHSPGLAETLAVLGKAKSLSRLKAQIEALS